MARKVYTYSSISNLKRHPNFHEIAAAPHITATKDLMESVSEVYTDIRDVIQVHSILREIVGEWDVESTRFQQYINLSVLMRKMNVAKGEQNLHRSFMKNKKAVLDAIRMLVEADLYPDYMEPSNSEERLFKAIWEKIEEENPSFGRFRSEMAICSSDANRFLEKLSEVVDNQDSDEIVLHGFYFITPIQDRVFRMMENAGKTLIFLSKIDHELPEVNRIWYENFSPGNGFAPVGEWVGAEVEKFKNEGFGLAFEGKSIEMEVENVSIRKYSSEIDFVRDMDRIVDQGHTLYTTDLSSSEKLLKEFYPDKFRKRHLLAYPVGQYIYQLHSMWDAANRRLELTVDDIQACFSSGWVIKGSANGLDHMMGLELLRTYVSDCRSLEEWEGRLDLLKKTKSDVLSNFEMHLENVEDDKRRWHRIMGNPFLNLSCFSYDEDRLDEMMILIGHLMDTAKKLFTGAHEVDLADHLNRVKSLLAESKDSVMLEDEERLILEELRKRLKIERLEVSRCLPEEVSEAIMLIIGGGMLDEDGFQRQSEYDDTFLKPIYMVESAPLSNQGKVHLCLADERRMPGSTGLYAWPVTRGMLDRMEPNIHPENIRYYRNMRFIVEQSPLANRYLFFSLLESDMVEMSWICKDRDKDLGPSPYIQILDSIFGIKVDSPHRSDWSGDDVEKIEEAGPIVSLNVDLMDLPAVEAGIDLVKCHWRYLYGYVLSDHPAYRSAFHYSFVLSRLISSFASLNGVNRDEVAEEVIGLFPYLRDVEIQSVIDHVGRVGDEGFDSIDNISYPNSRLPIHFLTDRIAKKGLDDYNDLLDESMMVEMDFSIKGDYQTCMYCPFTDDCPHAEHHKGEVS